MHAITIIEFEGDQGFGGRKRKEKYCIYIIFILYFIFILYYLYLFILYIYIILYLYYNLKNEHEQIMITKSIVLIFFK